MATIWGEAVSERLDGTDAADLIYGGGGVDEYYPSFGDDTCFGGASNDFFHNSIGSDVSYGGAGNDYLIVSLAYAPELDGEAFFGGSGVDTLWLFGLPQDQAVQLDAGLAPGEVTLTSFGTSFHSVEIFNIALVGTGDDRLLTGKGADTVSSGLGDDLIDGRGRNDSLTGSYGNDSLTGGRGDDLLDGDQGGASFGDDRLYGSTGRDFLTGGGGRDHLFGGRGDDSLTGSSGDDDLRGGDGADRFSFLPAMGRDVITDFDLAEGDVLLISRGLTGAAATADAVISGFAKIESGHVVLDFGAGNQIVLSGVFSNAWLADGIMLL